MLAYVFYLLLSSNVSTEINIQIHVTKIFEYISLNYFSIFTTKKKISIFICQIHTSYDNQKRCTLFQIHPYYFHLNNSINTSCIYILSHEFVKSPRIYEREANGWKRLTKLQKSVLSAIKTKKCRIPGNFGFQRLRIGVNVPSSFFEQDAISPGRLSAMIESSCSISNCVTTVYSRNPIVQ